MTTAAETPSPAEYIALLRADFASFAQHCFYELNPRTAFAPGWHHEVIAAKLAAVSQGHIRRLIINLPPRHLKSHLASIAFPAWCLGHDPGMQILCVSYAQDLADKLSRDCRRILASDWYRQVFATRLSAQRQAASEFDTTAQGCRLATSVGGVLTGRGADIIIIDDPLKPEEALSQAQRHAANEWYDHTLYSRLNDTRTGAIILIMHRLHESLPSGLTRGTISWATYWRRRIGTSCAFRRSPRTTRPTGSTLDWDGVPSRDGVVRPCTPSASRWRPSTGSAARSANTTLPANTSRCRRRRAAAAWFRAYAANERPDTFDRIVQSWDTANKASELSDFSVCTTWGIKGKDLFLLHVLRRRMEYPELKRAVREQARAFDATVVLIEDKASGTQLIQELVQDGLHAVTRYQPQADKIMRMHAQTAMIENGFVHLPKEAAWLAEYLHELTAFPKGRHDDQVDSTAQMLDWFKQAGAEPQDWMWQLYKQQHRAQEAHTPRPEPLSVIAKRLGLLRW
jgi:predicted phage terminase large subunit-like protein